MRYLVSFLVSLALVLTLGTSAFANHVSTVSLCSDVVPFILFSDGSNDSPDSDDSPSTFANAA